jgi:hypothetical protein
MKSFQEYLNESLRDYVDGKAKDGTPVQIGAYRNEKLKAFMNLLARYAKTGKVPSGLELAKGNKNIDFSSKDDQETVYIFKNKDIKVEYKYSTLNHPNGNHILKVQRVG